MSKQTFVANTILTAAQMNTLQTNDYNQTVSTKTASYTLIATDVGTKIVMNSASATTITVNTSLFAAGDNLTIANIGAGVCTVTAGTATVSSAGPLAIPQYGGGTLYFTSAGVSTFFGSAGPAASSGMTLIAAQTTTTAATQTFSNVFSATYSIYKVFTVITSANTQELQFRFASAGSANTNSSYSYTLAGNDGAGFYGSSSQGTPQNKISLAQNLNGNGQIELTIQNPFESVISRVISQSKGYYSGGGTQYSQQGGGLFDNTTSFDGFEYLNANGSTFTYATTIYGLAKS